MRGGALLRHWGSQATKQSSFCWAAFTNARRANSQIDDDLDTLNWNMVREVASWRA